jgi:hypothetical protein
MGDSVFINGRAAVHKGSSGKSTASPDVCLCPPGPPAGPVPTPLVNTVVAADMDGGASTVLIEGNPQGTRRSFFRKSTGNEVARATGGGVLTGVVQGQARFGFGYSRNVYIEGEPAVRHLDPLTHNHAGFAGNTPPAPWVSKMDPDVPRMPPLNLIKEAGPGKDWIEISVIDEAREPLAGSRLVVSTPDGATVEGTLLGAGVVLIRGLATGVCELELPDVDEQCRSIGRRKEARTSDPGVQLYKPGSRLQLQTGLTHRIVAPGVVNLFVEVVLRPMHRAGEADRFTLTSTDGEYEVSCRPSSAPRTKDRTCFLRFAGLIPGLAYTLIHQRDGAPAREVFAAQPFEDLFPSGDAESGSMVARRRVDLKRSSHGELRHG